MSRRCVSLALLLLVGAMGCGSSDGRVEVSGMVTFQKAPLDQGTIQFLPENPQAGSMLMLPIRDGKYSITRDKGLLPGSYKVILSSPAPGAKQPPPDGPPGDSTSYVHKERLPAEYNSDSKKAVTLEAGKANVFNFDIP